MNLGYLSWLMIQGGKKLMGVGGQYAARETDVWEALDQAIPVFLSYFSNPVSEYRMILDIPLRAHQ